MAKYIKTDLGNALPKLRPFSKEKYTAERDKMCIGEMKVSSKESGICCANVLYSRRNGSRCCLNFKLRQGITYSQRKQICCEGEILDKDRSESYPLSRSILISVKCTQWITIFYFKSWTFTFQIAESENGDVAKEWNTKKQKIIAVLGEN